MKTSHDMAKLTMTRVLLAFALMFPSSAGFADPPPSQRPNVIFILVDDLGYGDLGAYGNQTIQTPHLDQLAMQGMRFTNYHTLSPVCGPTRASIVTGQYPHRLAIRDNMAVADGEKGLPASAPTLHQLFRNAGYTTLHVGKWHLGFTPESLPSPERGVDHFIGFLRGNIAGEAYPNPTLTRVTREGTRNENFRGHLNDILTSETIRLIRQANEEGRNFFTMLWHFAPHAPFIPPGRWRSRYPNSPEGRRAALISSLDESVGTLMQSLREMGLAENTILVFVSDNGAPPEYGNGGSMLGHLRGGKDELLEGGIRVPLIIRWPDHIAPGSESDALASSFDFFRTLTEMAGIDSSQIFSDGRSFYSVLTGQTPSRDFTLSRGPLVLETRADRYDINSPMDFAVLEGPWKLLRRQGKIFLLDVEQEPGERRNLATRHPDVVNRLWDIHRRWRWETGTVRYEFAQTRNVNVRGDLLDFTHGPGHAVINDHSDLDPYQTDFSLSVWVRPERFPEQHTAVIAAKGKGWRLVMERGGRVVLHLYEREDTDPINLVSETRLPLNEWTQVSFTIRFRTILPGAFGRIDPSKPGRARLLINGRVEREGMIDRVSPNDDKISVSALTRPFHGKMKGLSFYTMELEDSEIRELLANHPVPGTRLPEPGDRNGRGPAPVCQSLTGCPGEEIPIKPVEPFSGPSHHCTSLSRASCTVTAAPSHSPDIRREPMQTPTVEPQPHH